MAVVEPGPELKSGPPIDPAVEQAYWRKTSGLMWIMMALWVFASFIIHIFAARLNAIQFIGFPLGFYMAAQGSLVIFVVSLFWFAARQNSIDEEFGVSED